MSKRENQPSDKERSPLPQVEFQNAAEATPLEHVMGSIARLLVDLARKDVQQTSPRQKTAA